MRRFLAFALLLMGVSLANAQAPTVICTPTTGGSCVPVNAANPLPIAGSFSATLTGFLSNGLFATLTATNVSSASTALPTGATANPSVRITNNGTTVVSCTMAAGAATGVANNILVQPGSSVSRVVGTFVNIACIDQTGFVSNPVVIEGGSGLGNDSGGGGSGGGGGGAITAAASSYAAGAFSAGAGVDGWDLTQGTKADAAYTGSGSASVIAILKGQYNALIGSLPAGPNIVGKFGIDQTTFGTTNGVVNAANIYNTIAASQTAQIMSATQAGGTGAAGDFLSHCVVTPGTTSPGVVTVLDNATAIISFAGGASSVSNLVPFALPIATKSTSGAWKITTGLNVTVACVGKFS